MIFSAYALPKVPVKVYELMQTHVRTVHCDATLAEAAVTLTAPHASALPVVDSRGRMMGVISGADVLAGKEELEPGRGATLLEETPVRRVMTPGSVTISPDADIREAAQQMLYADLPLLFVVHGGRPIGVVSTTDILRAVATEKLVRKATA